MDEELLVKMQEWEWACTIAKWNYDVPPKYVRVHEHQEYLKFIGGPDGPLARMGT